VRGADWEYRISGGRGSGGNSPSDAEAISAFMWLKVHQNQHLNVTSTFQYIAFIKL